MDEQINKMWYIYTRKYYSAIKRNGVLDTCDILVNLKMLNEEGQMQNATLLYESIYVTYPEELNP